MQINTNISSLTTQKYLEANQKAMTKSMERLSSGERINTAADDAAGLAIATRMTTQINGKDVATRNIGDGISLIQTAESAMGSIANILQRMRELSVQADNGTYGSSDKSSMESEFDQLKQEVDNIATKTTFNGVNLLDGTLTLNPMTIHTGDIASDTLQFQVSDTKTTALGGWDFVNSLPDSDPLSVSPYTYLSDVHIDNSTGAGTYTGNPEDAMTVIDHALDQISSKRAELGALQNRLNFTLDNLSSSSINLSTARSRIQDADMASEMSEMTKNKILSQSSISMLSQANQQPQMLLQLLQNNG